MSFWDFIKSLFGGKKAVAPAPAPVAPAPTPHPTPVTLPLPGPLTDHLPGIDVSRYQDGMSWDAVAKSGRVFAFVKASDGMGGDPDFVAFRKLAKAAGLSVGCYHFFRFDVSAADQIKNFIAKMGQWMPGELPPVLDVEWDKQSRNYGDGKCMDAASYKQVLAACNQIKDWCGVYPIIYTSKPFWEGRDTPPAEFAKVLLWVAGYVGSIERVKIPKPWTRATFWQFTDEDKILNIGHGITGVDGDYFYGSPADLKALTRQ